MSSMDGINGCSIHGFNEFIHWIKSMDGFTSAIQLMDSTSGLSVDSMVGTNE